MLKFLAPNLMTIWVLVLLAMPFLLIPNASAWTAGDEAAVFGHTFEEEYWTNDSIFVEGANGNTSEPKTPSHALMVGSER